MQLTEHPIVKEHLKEEFNLPNYHPLTISNDDTNKGFVEVNENLNIQTDSWTGDYFETVPVKLTAVAEFGFEFSRRVATLLQIVKLLKYYFQEL